MQRSVRLLRWGVLCALPLAIGCGSSEEGLLDFRMYFTAADGQLYDANPEALLVVDANRDGRVEVSDPEDVDHRFDRGGLFLANIDDDAGRCGEGPDEEALHQCSDAQVTSVVNDEDLRDLARFRIAPINASPETTATITIDEASVGRVRLYRNLGGGETAASFQVFDPLEDVISAEALREGVEFAIEGLELIEDRAIWDGRVELTLQLEVGERELIVEDRAALQLAPVLFRHHLDAATRVYAANLGIENRTFRSDLARAAEAAGVEETDWLDTWDPWTQDYFEVGYMAMPGPEGPQEIQVYFRSANLTYPVSLEPVMRELYTRGLPDLLREAGSLVHTDIAGAGRSGRTIYDPDKGYEPVEYDPADANDIARYLYGEPSRGTYPEVAELYDLVYESDTLDSFGNTETIPPHIAPDGTAYPHGRLFRGRGADPKIRPDTRLSSVFDAQGLQPTVWVSTDWLIVAHVDETISFVQTNSERGWTTLFADPVQARAMLEELQEDGHGGRLLFEDLTKPDYDCFSWNCPDLPAERTIDEVLDDTRLMAASARAAVEIDSQKEVLRQEVGLKEEDFVGVPFLFEGAMGEQVAYQPGMVNGISLRPDVFGTPRPFGPVVNGRDVFEVRMEEIIADLGMSVEWIEAWDVYHVGLGEVHCGSNVERSSPEQPWWTKEER